MFYIPLYLMGFARLFNRNQSTEKWGSSFRNVVVTSSGILVDGDAPPWSGLNSQ